jgi:hypothetical protein
MTTTTSTVFCTTPNCPNPATDTLPILAPGDENDVVCHDCLTAYWEARNSESSWDYIR